MKVINCQQGTPEWIAARLGKVTASRFKDAIAGGRGKTRNSYMLKLIAERLTGEPQESFSNAVMQRGIETEPLAREYYELFKDVSVEQVGFIERNKDVGASPDGLVHSPGMVEIKCPNSTTHIETILTGKVPATHKPQIQGQLWVCEREWCDFVSYDNRVYQKPFFCERVFRDEEYIKELSIKIQMFITDMNELIKTFDPF